MAEADSQIAACSPSFGCAGRVDTSFHVERYRSDVTRGGFYYAHPFSPLNSKCARLGGPAIRPLLPYRKRRVPKGRLNLAQDAVLGRVKRVGQVPSGTAGIFIDSMDGKKFLQLVLEADPFVVFDLSQDIFDGCCFLRNTDRERSVSFLPRKGS
jgi:hypothetical protein